MHSNGHPGYSTDRTGELIASRCTKCGYTACPPILIHCDNRVDTVTLPPEGIIESWTTVHVAPEKFDPPYTLVSVRLDDGPRIPARLEDDPDGGTPETGVRVRLKVQSDDRSTEYRMHGLIAWPLDRLDLEREAT